MRLIIVVVVVVVVVVRRTYRFLRSSSLIKGTQPTT
jgi:hypothetical protein